ncbi:MAG: hypothetical protein M9928_07315 [Anaerolineae bacterium]|nr:hypothetical protein [Anaerolineae bacterium]MCO5204823.1 hypothetical protein [Anaerolineae bacterium]
MDAQAVAEKRIRDAWVMGIAAGIISILLTMIYATGASFAHVDPWAWIEIVVIFVLSFGIYRKSRLSAILLLLFYVGSRVIFWIDEQTLIGIPMALVFGYFFLQGVRGTIDIHRLHDESEFGSKEPSF